jgi:hypothetical protein
VARIELEKEIVQFDDVRVNAERVQDFLNDNPLSTFEGTLFELTFTTCRTNVFFPNPLPFIPTDIIVTSSSEDGFVTFNTGLFNEQFLSVSSSGACTIRCFIGRFTEDPVRISL